jgi:hypothetical protein
MLHFNFVATFVPTSKDQKVNFPTVPTQLGRHIGSNDWRGVEAPFRASVGISVTRFGENFNF